MSEFCTQMPCGETLESRDIVHPISRHSANDGPLALPIQDGVLWNNGTTLRVRFLGGDAITHDRVRKYVKIWEEHANITFKFVTGDQDSDIRIAFNPKGGHRSLVGTNSLRAGPHEATMNLAINSQTSEEKVRRTVLHEFGHVLGCVHEHSSPAASIPWDHRAVYNWYRTNCRWDDATIKLNVLDPATNVSQFSHFDPDSIMLYPILPHLTNGRLQVNLNTELSETDKSFIAMIYPPDEVKCGYCTKKINTSKPKEGHRYCEVHRDYLCARCYNWWPRYFLGMACSYRRPPAR